MANKSFFHLPPTVISERMAVRSNGRYVIWVTEFRSN